MGVTYVFPTRYTADSVISINKRINNLNSRTENMAISAITALVSAAGYDGYFIVGYTEYYRWIRAFRLSTSNDIYCADQNYPNVPSGYALGTYAGTDINFSPLDNFSITVDNTLYNAGTANQNTTPLDNRNYYGFSNLNTSDPNTYPTILVLINVDNTVYLNNVNVTPIEYNWKSIKSLNLASAEELGFNTNVAPLNNQSSMLISYIPDEHLNDGEQVLGGRNFVQKSPSLADFIDRYGSQNFTSKNIFLNNKNYVIIGRQSIGISTSRYKFTFLSKFDPASILPQITYYETTIDVGLVNGIPYLGFIVDEENTAVKLNVIYIRTLVDQSTGIKTQVADYNTITMTDQQMNNLYAWLNGSYGYEEESDGGAENPDQGGNETDPVENDPLNRLSLPTKGSTGSGFIKLYEVDTTQMQALCAFMWDDSLLANLGRLFEDPREIIVGLMVFPIGPTNTTTQHIHAGNLDTGVNGDLLATEYLTRYAGELKVPKGDANFMSFAPYRRMTLILPYCEEVEIDPSAVYGCTLRLYYHLSFFSGNCVVEITREGDDGIEAPFMFAKGQIGYSIPLSSVDYSRVYSSLITGAMQIGAGAVSGNVGAMGSGISGLLDGSCAPRVTYKGAGGASHGALSCQQPYIVFEETIPAYDGDQSNYVGYTYYKTKKLSDCVGFTKCFEAHIEGIHASDSELEEIMSWLTNGVLIHQDGSTTPSTTPTVSGNTVITTMKLTSERNVIGKKWTDASQIEGKLIYDQSITNPSILINGNSIDFNYAYIGLFNRFYFVTDVIVRNKDLIEVKLKSDPLQSFKDDILNCYASVNRQKHNGNKFLHDPYMWAQVNKKISTMSFTIDGIPYDWGHSEDTYILAIAGT